jgi:hypothetical protein
MKKIKILELLIALSLSSLLFSVSSCWLFDKKSDEKQATDSCAVDKCLYSPSNSSFQYVDSAEPVPPAPPTPPVVQKTATVEKIWIDEYSDRIRVHVNFSVTHMLNKTGSLIVYIVKQHNEDNDSNSINNKGGYRDYTYKSDYEDCEWKDYIIDDITYAAIANTVSEYCQNFKLCIKITDDNDSVLTTSDYVSFSIPEHIDNYNIGC